MDFLKKAASFISPVTGLITGASTISGMPSKEELADRWIIENLPNPAYYSATLATLSNDITGWSNRCGDYIHQRNPLYNRANGRSICQSKIENIYQANLTDLKYQEKQDSDDLKYGGDNSKLIAVVVLVIIVMIIVVLILKM